MRKFTPGSLAFVTVLMLSLVLLAACGGQPKSEGPKAEGPKSEAPKSAERLKLQMGTEPWIGYGPWWIAEAKGLFAKHGLDVQLVAFTTDADLDAALAANRIQAGNIATHTAIKLIQNNKTDMKLILFMDQSMKADAVIAKGVSSLKDLKGKKVAFEEGTTSDLLLRYGLKQNGLTIKDIQPVPMPAADAGSAVISGAVPVAVTYEPYITNALRGRQGVNLIYSGQDAPGLISDFTVIRSDFLKQNPAVSKELAAVWQEALDYWQANKNEGNKIVGKAVGLKPEELPPILDGVKLFTIDQNQAMVKDGSLYKAFKDIGQVLIDQAAVKDVPKPEDVIDFSKQK